MHTTVRAEGARAEDTDAGSGGASVWAHRFQLKHATAGLGVFLVKVERRGLAECDGRHKQDQQGTRVSGRATLLHHAASFALTAPVNAV
jgi:hypothetical protein